MAMSLLRYLKPVTSLPTAEQTGLPAITLKKAVQDALGHAAKTATSRTRKYTITFTPEDQASIRRYAAENGNSAAVKTF